VESRHWHEQDGFYYDWDVTAGKLIRVKNQDAFYLPYFLRNQARAKRLFEHLDNPEEFALLYTPTLAKNEAGFRPHGYWSGGYWPREMVYIARSLAACGRRESAVELLVKAICCAAGKVIPENMDPITGEDATHVTGMAYNAVNVLELVRLRQAQ
jgi:glycogen debranching enzyme